MRVSASIGIVNILLALGICFGAVSGLLAKEWEPLEPSAPDRLPRTIDGRFITPELGGFWTFDLKETEYPIEKDVDAIANCGAFDALTLTLRQQNSLWNYPLAHDVTKRAVEYGLTKNIGALLDVDLRIARFDFEKKRPELAQERLFFVEAETDSDEDLVEVEFEAPCLEDHYTGNLPYYVRGARVVKAWAYNDMADTDIVDPDTLADVTALARWDRSQYYVKDVPGSEVDDFTFQTFKVAFKREDIEAKGTRITVAIAFRYAYPDLFSDETLALQRAIYESFSDVPVFGVCKDEWGFPPNFDRDEGCNDFWFSDRASSLYAGLYPERCLIDDLFLVSKAQKGKEEDRVDALDRYRKMCNERVVEYETKSYEWAKEIWGRDAFVGVHPTWYAWPNLSELRKNGLMWWKVARDIAQTDEYTAFCIRNSMAKGTKSHWINMFYAPEVSPYFWEHWTAAASGGRVHMHQIYPRENDPSNRLDVEPKLTPIAIDGGLAKVRAKIRMLSIVSESQIDSPVAVIFSRLAAANPLRLEYDVFGWDICDRFSTQGYPADLTPVDEFSSRDFYGKPRWNVSDDGYLQYGEQKYQVLILYGKSDAEKEEYGILDELVTSTDSCKTRIEFLPPDASDDDVDELVKRIVMELEELGTPKQTPWVKDEYLFAPWIESESSTRPPRTCVSRFIDGTIQWIAAEKNDFGDPIVLEEEVLPLKGNKATPKISVEANGVFALRFDDDGVLNAVVASELRSLHIGELDVVLDADGIGSDPIDIAIWRDSNGKWRGVFQREKNDLPKSLEALVPTWNYLWRH